MRLDVPTPFDAETLWKPNETFILFIWRAGDYKSLAFGTRSGRNDYVITGSERILAEDDRRTSQLRREFRDEEWTRSRGSRLFVSRISFSDLLSRGLRRCVGFLFGGATGQMSGRHFLNARDFVRAILAELLLVLNFDELRER